MKKFKKISRLPEFRSDMRKLHKRYRTLREDLGIFINTAPYAYHKLREPVGGIVRIGDLRVKRQIFKVTSFACRSLKGKGKRSGIRVIYTYYEEEDEIELIEIYYKGDKENENRDRIRRHYK